MLQTHNVEHILVFTTLAEKIDGLKKRRLKNEHQLTLKWSKQRRKYLFAPCVI